MSGKRQKIQPEQLGLALLAEARSEAPSDAEQGTETPTAKRAHESPADSERLMEEVCERENAGDSGAAVERNLPTPTGQARVEIDKPEGGGVRKLGVPTLTS